MKRPDRFPRKSCAPSLMSAHRLRLSHVKVKPVRSGMVESLRGRMGESARQAEGLFQSLLVLSFVEGLAEVFS